MSTQHKSRETNIHTVRVKGVPASVSDQTGAIVLFGRPEYERNRVFLRGRSDGLWGKTFDAQFRVDTIEGKKQTIAVFNRLPAGKYYLDGYYLHGFYRDLVVNTNWAEEVHC